MSDRPFHAPWPQRAAYLLLLTLLAALAATTIFRAAFSQVEHTDFTVYRAAAQAVLDGSDLYAAHNARGWNYVYPPPLAVLMAPLARIPVAWGALLWFLLALLVSGRALQLAAALASDGGRRPERTLWLAFAVLPWWLSGIMRGQASELMVWLVVAAVCCELRGQPWRAGASLGGAILLKVFPATLLLWFAWRRQWRALAAVLLVLLLGGLLLPGLVRGWQHNLDDLREWSQLMAQPALLSNQARQDNPLFDQLLDARKPRNQSLQSLLLLWRTDGRGVQALLIASALAMLLAMALRARRMAAGDAPLLAGAAVCWMLLIPPISESHYFVAMLVPLAALAREFDAADAQRRRIARAGSGAFVALTLFSVSFQQFDGYRPLCWATLIVWASTLHLLASARKTPTSGRTQALHRDRSSGHPRLHAEFAHVPRPPHAVTAIHRFTGLRVRSSASR